MARLLKILLVFVAAFVGVALVAAIALYVFFDPNDFRDDISAAVKAETGRDLEIEGDLRLSLFPWLAVEIGRTKLGNAEGFGDQPFLSFESARLSVRLLPLILRQEITVGTAGLESLNVNLAVNKRGVSNWDDLTSRESEEKAPDAEGGAPSALDIANVRVNNATISYRDVQAGSSATLSGLTLETGRIALGEDFQFSANFSFELFPDEISGNVAMGGKLNVSDDMQKIGLDDFNVSGNLRGITEAPTEFNFDARTIAIDTAAENIALGEMDMGILGISLAAKVEPFSYAGDPQPKASIRVNQFSLKDLLQRLGEEAPETADPNAMQKVSFSANAAVGKNDIALNDIQMLLDDTTMQGKIVLPKAADGTLRFDLQADRIVLDNYMAPGTENAAAANDAGTSDVEMPVELIRSLNAQGSFKLGTAMMTGIEFTNMLVTLNAKDGKLRLNPMSADIFEGRYDGDVRIDASGKVPVLAVDEKIIGVKLTPLAKAMFDADNIDGTVDGRFTLNGRGASMSAIQRSLAGNIAIELKDGAYVGTDVWYQLRSARATLKQQTPPEPRLPPRTEFSSIAATGTVTDGVMTSNDLVADLPFLRITGNGQVHLVEGTIDYRMDANVLGKPELARGLTAEEVNDFTSVVIPMKVTGPLASPSIKPDINALLKREVEKQIDKKKDEITNKLMDKLLGTKKPPAEEAPAAGDAPADEEPAPEEEEKKSPEDQLKDALKDALRR